MSHKIISQLFRLAKQEGAHGLVIESGLDHLALDYHFPDGAKKSFALPKKLEKELLDSLRQLIKVAPGELAAKKYCKINDKTHGAAFYVTILSGTYGEKIIINLVEKKPRLWYLKQLGCSQAILKNLSTGLKMRSGLILVSGPALSGKSATLYSCLKEVNTHDKNIYLLDERPEEVISGVNILNPTSANWDKILQHDCEVIAVGDLDQDENLEYAVRAAATGRLVLGAITADNVWATFQKILALPLPLSLKLDSLKIMTSQRLAKMKRQPRPRAKNQRQFIALFELLKLTPTLKKFILDHADALETRSSKITDRFWKQLATLAVKEGFVPLTAELKRRRQEGILRDAN